MKNFLESDKYSKLIKTLGILLTAFVIFGAGVFVGNRKADFSNRWDNNYFTNFGGPHSPFGPMGFSDADDSAPIPHGAFGTVIGVNLPTFAVKGPNEAEKVVVIGPNTVIRSIHSLGTTTDIRTGQSVVIIGEPDSEGQINASFVRIMPMPPPGFPSTSSAPMMQTMPPQQ